MTMNATVFWQLPTVDENGEIMDPRDIAGVKVELRIVGAPWDPDNPLQPLVPRDTLELLVPDLDIGDWEFRLTAVNINGKESPDPVLVPFRVPNDLAPGPVENARVELS